MRNSRDVICQKTNAFLSTHQQIELDGAAVFVQNKLARRMESEKNLIILEHSGKVVSFEIVFEAEEAITLIEVTHADGKQDTHCYEGGRVELVVESIDSAYIRRAPGVQDHMRVMHIDSIDLDVKGVHLSDRVYLYLEPKELRDEYKAKTLTYAEIAA